MHRKLEGDTMRIVCPNWIRTHPIQCRAEQYNWRSWLEDAAVTLGSGGHQSAGLN